MTVVLDNPATDREPDEIVISYPPISRAAIQAPLCYTLGLAEELDEMKLSELAIENYRSLREGSIAYGDLNLFIGANASGKSTILDALRFLHEGMRAREFQTPVFHRGGMIHLAWKGDAANRIQLVVRLEGEDRTYEWVIRLVKEGAYGFYVEEEVSEERPKEPPVKLLESSRGAGWWWSGEKGERVTLKQNGTACALAAAAADASFPARDVAEFVGRWGFFDPSPFLLRHDWTTVESGRLDPYGRNLGETLYAIDQSSPEALEKIVAATREIVGLPDEIEIRESESDGRFYFLQNEPGLRYRVHQMGISSGTLRMLALMTALLAETERNLIGIEEPENYVHPAALNAFAQYLLKVRERGQFLVTTHSPLLLDYLNEPEAVRVVQRDEQRGTIVLPQENPDGVRRALEASEFGLGEFYETKGFGAD